MLDEDMVNEKGDGSFIFKCEAPTSGNAGFPNVPMPSTATQVAPTSGSRTVIMPPTAGLVEKLMAVQRAMPS